ncbi:MAG: beta-galactosidase [Oscillospiraceae bacterium]|nr:beta-galactosidase [Oscillospiraceae bacterium]
MKKLYLGAAYYPEVFGKDLPTLDEDIRYMKEGGFNVMRIAEFSWSSMEPHDGVFDFAWLHRIVDTLGENGIKTLMCTPSATPPAWLTKKYPETLAIEDTRIRQHGERRHCCSNSAVFREYTRRIVEKMAQEFAHDKNVIGWQLDNEISPMERGCACPSCMRLFHDRLRGKFGTVENLNRAWNLGMWSQEYESFEDVPHPDKKTWSNPSLIAEYIDFSSDSHASFLHMQAKTLREGGVRVPIGTDMMPIFTQHYPKTVAPLDICQYNHYNTRENLWQAAFWFDYVQNLKPDVPFWNTETSTSFNGSAAAPDSHYPLGFCRINSLLPYAFGGEMNSYWLWRQHPSGHELMHGYVVSTQGRPVYNFGEIRDVSAILNKTEDFLTSTKVRRSGFAMSVSSTAGILFQAAPTVEGFDYRASLIARFGDFMGSGMLPELLDTTADLSGVKVLYSPYLMTLDQGDFASRLEAWIRDGGIWIAGPLTDIRDANIAKYPSSPYGMIERLTGIYNDFGLAASHIPARVRWLDWVECDASLWTDVFTLKEGMEPVAVYTKASEPSPVEGYAAAAFCPVGKGGVIVLGTQPSRAALLEVVDYAFEKAGIEPGVTSTDNVFAIPREGRENGLILAEVGCTAGSANLDGTYEDLVTGEKLSGETALAPYEFRVLRRVN